MEMMNLTKALEETRLSTRRPKEYDAVLMQHFAKAALEESNKSNRRLVMLGAALFAIMLIVMLFLAWSEGRTMTDEQRATIERIIN